MSNDNRRGIGADLLGAITSYNVVRATIQKLIQTPILASHRKALADQMASEASNRRSLYTVPFEGRPPAFPFSSRLARNQTVNRKDQVTSPTSQLESLAGVALDEPMDEEDIDDDGLGVHNPLLSSGPMLTDHPLSYLLADDTELSLHVANTPVHNPWVTSGTGPTTVHTLTSLTGIPFTPTNSYPPYSQQGPLVPSSDINSPSNSMIPVPIPTTADHPHMLTDPTPAPNHIHSPHSQQGPSVPGSDMNPPPNSMMSATIPTTVHDPHMLTDTPPAPDHIHLTDNQQSALAPDPDMHLTPNSMLNPESLAALKGDLHASTLHPSPPNPSPSGGMQIDPDVHSQTPTHTPRMSDIPGHLTGGSGDLHASTPHPSPPNPSPFGGMQIDPDVHSQTPTHTPRRSGIPGHLTGGSPFGNLQATLKQTVRDCLEDFQPVIVDDIMLRIPGVVQSVVEQVVPPMYHRSNRGPSALPPRGNNGDVSNEEDDPHTFVPRRRKARPHGDANFLHDAFRQYLKEKRVISTVRGQYVPPSIADSTAVRMFQENNVGGPDITSIQMDWNGHLSSNTEALSQLCIDFQQRVRAGHYSAVTYNEKTMSITELHAYLSGSLRRHQQGWKQARQQTNSRVAPKLVF
ncbi:hypothetical protein BJ138DRAFT_1118951 [Hygrophoropsis aurantiaca]|uniref:Uncharacterized protein n=1 Tax=Hygrophoropsis aurantiaca TaxID=72124 RepID=A0ACB7ZVD5_9AGAM|nr:hypothetical protein BJ138DRAFT_1118951 [Hygrophoropsis aurantiaca]